jgi:hypothetical protein
MMRAEAKQAEVTHYDENSQTAAEQSGEGRARAVLEALGGKQPMKEVTLT